MFHSTQQLFVEHLLYTVLAGGYRALSKGNKSPCFHGAYHYIGERKIKKYMSKIQSRSEAMGAMENKMRQGRNEYAVLR